MRRSLAVLFALAAVALVVNACTPEQPFTLVIPELAETFTDVESIKVSGTADGPLLHSYRSGGSNEIVNDVPTDENAPVFNVYCVYGIDEAEFPDNSLYDAWDGSYLYSPDYVAFDDGTLRSYDDGTLILTCAASNPPAGLNIERHLVFPGSADQGRFMVDVLDIVGASDTPVDISDLEYYVNDGADDSMLEPWETFGSVGAFEWATKDDDDLSDPAVGLLPLVSTKVEVDTDATGGDLYYVVGSDGATLALGERAVIAMVAGIRGDFDPGSLAGKTASMQALGAELAPLAGDAFCRFNPPVFYVWSYLLEDSDDIRDAICAGYAGL
ncbi:MAG: hypothetical protein ACNA8N_10235 [Trueperaceae bacterium]